MLFKPKIPQVYLLCFRFLLFTFAFQRVGCDYWNCIFEACLILLYFESQKFHKCIYSTNYCVHLVSNYIFIHICITAFQWVWVELLEPYYWSMFPIVVAKLAQQMKGGFHLPLIFLICLPVLSNYYTKLWNRVPSLDHFLCWKYS